MLVNTSKKLSNTAVLQFIWLSFAILFISVIYDCKAQESSMLNLEDMLETVIANNPSLQIEKLNTNVMEGILEQSALRSNPELFLEAEDFGGSGEAAGTENMAYSAGIKLEIVAGGKRGKQIHETELALQAAELEYEDALLQKTAEVKKAFFTALTLQRKLELIQSARELTLKMNDAVRKMVQGGEASPLDLLRSRMEISEVEREYESVSSEYFNARTALAALMSMSPKTFNSNYYALTGEFSKSIHLNNEIQKFSEVNISERSPSYQLMKLKVSQAEAALELAEAERISDIELEGGVTHSRESGDRALFAGISFALPVSDRRSGAVKASRVEVEQAKKDLEGFKMDMLAELTSSLENLKSADNRLRKYDSETLQTANELYKASEVAFKAGEASLIELIDSKNALAKVKIEMLELKYEFECAKIELERLNMEMRAQ